MLKSATTIKVKGANFETATLLPLLCDNNNNSAKATLLYGRNGSGKSTIARAFRKIKTGEPANIQTAILLDAESSPLTLSEEDKKHIFVFDEDFVSENVRIQEDGLGSIAMLGEKVWLTDAIEKVTKELALAETLCNQKKLEVDGYNNPANEKSPRYFLDKMYAVLQRDDGWAGKKRKIDNLRRNASVTDNTYKDFTGLSPQKSRDELLIAFARVWEHLEKANSGTAKINISVPAVPSEILSFKMTVGNELLKKKIEHPELSEREEFLLELVQSGEGEYLKDTATEFENDSVTICPKCFQPISREYKAGLIESIQAVLSEEVKEHQKELGKMILNDITIDLELFSMLPSYQICIDHISSIRQSIVRNNTLLESKIGNPYAPIDEKLVSIEDSVLSLNEELNKLEEERVKHNETIADTRPIKAELTSINNEIAHWDVIDFSKQYESSLKDKEEAEKNYKEAQLDCKEKQQRLNDLNAQRDSIDIAIDVINAGLKYIFFSEDRMQIHVENKEYKLKCNGRPVKPKDVSVGERNIIGLCYFFAHILEGKSRNEAYKEGYLLVIDDPVSSYDLENRVGILSYLKYELAKYLLGSPETKVLVMTHDLFTAIDIGNMYKELMSDCKKRYSNRNNFVYSQKELSDHQIVDFINKRNEYTELIKLVYNYANGAASEQEPYIGNIIRQVLEAFSTFEFKKGISEVSTDDDILSIMQNDNHRRYFKNLMYRLVLNEGSHRFDQTRNMHIDFFSFISEKDKRRTAKDVLCFIGLLNMPHIRAHLGENEVNNIKIWCEETQCDE